MRKHVSKETSSEKKAQIRFLIVDDMITMRRTVRNMLRQMGYVHILEAEDGLDAWEKLPTAKIDIAIVDWNMPRMSGVELLRKARADERFAKIPFVIVTAEVDESPYARYFQEVKYGVAVRMALLALVMGAVA